MAAPAGVEHAVFFHPTRDDKVLKFMKYGRNVQNAKDIEKYLENIELHNLFLNNNYEFFGVWRDVSPDDPLRSGDEALQKNVTSVILTSMLLSLWQINSMLLI